VFHVWTRNGAFLRGVSDAEQSTSKGKIMKTNLALLAAGAIILTPALAAASQPAQPATGAAPDTAAPSAAAPNAAANTDQASDACPTAKASDKATNAKDPVTKSASKDESVKKVTRDTGIADATPPPKSKKTKDQSSSC
jgi:hypothetical protein